MHVPRPKMKNEISWTTLIAAAGLLVTIVGWVWSAGQFSAAVAASQKNSAEARARLQADIASTQSDVKDLKSLDSKFDNLAYRVTVQEQGSQQFAKAIEDLKNGLSDQGADIKVIREILTRLDAKAKGQ